MIILTDIIIESERLQAVYESPELSRKKQRAEKLRVWLMDSTNRMRSTYEVIATDYRNLIQEIDSEESENTLLNLNR